MQKIRVYNEIQPTYTEFALVLQQLSYQNQTNDKFFCWEHRGHRSIVKLPLRPVTALVVKANVASYSYLLYMQGVLNHIDDLAKMIEKNRLRETKSVNDSAD